MRLNIINELNVDLCVYLVGFVVRVGIGVGVDVAVVVV